MRYSKLFAPTTREVPKGVVSASHELLLRGGFIRGVGAGLYELLPLGVRVLQRVLGIIREEMNAAGYQEVSMPALLPKEYFEESQRWESFGDTLFRLKDRKGSDFHLGPTHEELFTDLARKHLKSYKQLPLHLYQVQTKFRDEPRPRAGLLRCREFLMKDGYSFDIDMDAAAQSFNCMRETYQRIFTRLGLDFRIVDADSGSMGGSHSSEFQILTQSGEDAIVTCPSCRYAANTEVAESAEASVIEEAKLGIVPVDTPGVSTIDELVAMIKPPRGAKQTIKTLIYHSGAGLIAAVVRGDHRLSEHKLLRAAQIDAMRSARLEEVKEELGAPFGSLGPRGVSIPIFVDPHAKEAVNAYAGANVAFKHLANINFGRDYTGHVVDLRLVEGGDACPRCGEPLEEYRGIEGGHIFTLGTHYSERMNALITDERGQSRPVVMGSYGIGVSRLVAAAVEQNHDEDGITWPRPLAPFDVVVVAAGDDAEVVAASEGLYAELMSAGYRALLDDRNERPGVKFKDAELIGIPLRLTVGKRGLKERQVEVQVRKKKQETSLPLENAVSRLPEVLQSCP